MIKLVILGCFLALIFAQNITFPPPQCDSTYYGNTDEACDNNLKRCKNFYVCKNGKCKRAHIGSECADNTDCFGWKEENLRCINKKCIKPRYPGYSCVDSGECWTGACVGGLCSGKQQGADCNPNNLAECDYGLYCSLAQKKCVPQLRLLQSCNDYAVQDDIPQGANYNIMCPGGSVCMGRSGAQSADHTEMVISVMHVTLKEMEMKNASLVSLVVGLVTFAFNQILQKALLVWVLAIVPFLQVKLVLVTMEIQM